MAFFVDALQSPFTYFPLSPWAAGELFSTPPPPPPQPQSPLLLTLDALGTELGAAAAAAPAAGAVVAESLSLFSPRPPSPPPALPPGFMDSYNSQPLFMCTVGPGTERKLYYEEMEKEDPVLKAAREARKRRLGENLAAEYEAKRKVAVGAVAVSAASPAEAAVPRAAVPPAASAVAAPPTAAAAPAAAPVAATAAVVPRALRRVFAPENEWMRRAVHVDPPVCEWRIAGCNDPIYARVVRLVGHDRHVERDPATGAALPEQPYCGMAWVRSGAGSSATPYCTNLPDTSRGAAHGLCRDCARGMAALTRHVRALVCDPHTHRFVYTRAGMQRVYDYVYAAACVWTFSRRAYQYPDAALAGAAAAAATASVDTSFCAAVARLRPGERIDPVASLDALAGDRAAAAPPREWVVVRASSDAPPVNDPVK